MLDLTVIFCCPHYYVYVVVGYKQPCICLMLNKYIVLYCIYLNRHVFVMKLSFSLTFNVIFLSTWPLAMIRFLLYDWL